MLSSTDLARDITGLENGLKKRGTVMIKTIESLTAFVFVLTFAGSAVCFAESSQWVVYDGFDGPGNGKHIVLVSGDEEYRSEEAMPQLGKILAKHHGFKCTVLFGIDPADGTIKPTVTNNIPGLEALETADLMIIFTRFRDLPDDQMKYIDDYIESGRPVIGMRTATHGFRFKDATKTKYAHYSSNSKEWDGGFGRQVLGETWAGHHGHHGKQSTRGVIADGMKDHPIVRGCEDIWGPSDTYTVNLPLPGDSQPLILGQVLQGMNPGDEPVVGVYAGNKKSEKKPNDPMMPVAWTKTYTGKKGNTCRVFNTTMGASVDLESEGVRRLLVNAAYWCVRMEKKIPKRAKVDIVGEFKPTYFGFGKFTPGLKPKDHAMK